jgi:hypothetical protein
MKKKNVNKRIDNSNDLKFTSVNLRDFRWRDQWKWQLLNVECVAKEDIWLDCWFVVNTLFVEDGITAQDDPAAAGITDFISAVVE